MTTLCSTASCLLQLAPSLTVKPRKLASNRSWITDLAPHKDKPANDIFPSNKQVDFYQLVQAHTSMDVVAAHMIDRRPIFNVYARTLRRHLHNL